MLFAKRVSKPAWAGLPTSTSDLSMLNPEGDPSQYMNKFSEMPVYNWSGDLQKNTTKSWKLEFASYNDTQFCTSVGFKKM